MRVHGSPFRAPEMNGNRSLSTDRNISTTTISTSNTTKSSSFVLNTQDLDEGGFPLWPTNSQSPSTDPSLTWQPSNDSTEGQSSVLSDRNWLDDFGKQLQSQQTKGNVDNMSTGNAIATLVVEKDPRFHCKRKKQVSNSSPKPKNEDLPSVLFPQDAMEDPQVFLAPVIVRSSETMFMLQQNAESPWKESTHGFASPPPSAIKMTKQRSSSIAPFVSDHENGNVVEAPGLATCTSQETAVSSTHSATFSTITSSSTSSSMASALVKRMVQDKPNLSNNNKDNAKARLVAHRPSIRSTPIRVKPRVRTQEVQATDQGYASVAKLSAWLADDPTSTKKVRHLRRGANVIAKSRMFDKDLEDVIVEEANIETGAVKEKKNWLQHAFEGDDNSEIHDHHHHDDHSNRHIMMMRTQPVNSDDCARSEFVVSNDNAASSISVTDKKKWLQNAFKGQNAASSSAARRPSYAQSDIGPVRESRDDITSRAKQMWRSSERRSSVAPSPYRTSQKLPASRDTPAKKSLEERMLAAMGPRVAAPPRMLAKSANTANMNERERPSAAQVEEDKTPVDFRAARNLLIQRSKQNGNELKLVSKVQSRANKFERITKESKRRSSAMGLLKPSWDNPAELKASGSDVSDAPSDSYIKTYVPDIAPKKSFEELP